MSNILVAINGVPGESTATGFADQIECLSMRHAIDLPVTTAETRVEGSSMHGPVELLHAIDKSSPLLKAAASAGTNLGTVTIRRMRTIAGQPREVEKIELSNAYVVRIDVDTPLLPGTSEPADEPFETFSLEYGRIAWTHTHFVNDMPKGTIAGSWSVETQTTV